MLLQELLNTSPLELIAGLGYLSGHFLLSKKLLTGWILKIIGGSAWTLFLYQNENYIFMAVTIVIVLTMIYGFYKWKSGRYNKRTKLDKFFEILTILVAAFMIFKFIFSGVFRMGPALETIIVIAEISGTILLAHKKISGWYAYIVMSSLAGLLVIFVNANPAIVLGVLEIASIYFYYRGIQNFQKNLTA